MPPFGFHISAVVPNSRSTASIIVSSFSFSTLGQRADMLVEMLGEVFRDDHLIERAGAAVGLAGDHARQHRPFRRLRSRRAAPARATWRTSRYARPAWGPTHTARRRAAAPDQIGVALVLEDRHAILPGKRQHLLAAFQRQDAAGRILDGGDGVDVFRRHALLLQALQRRGQCIHPHAVLIQRHADDVGTDALEPVDRAGVAEFLQDHGVARIDEQSADHVDALAGAGRDQHLVAR